MPILFHVYVLKQLNAPVYATRLTLALIDGKLREHGILDMVDRRVLKGTKVPRLTCPQLGPPLKWICHQSMGWLQIWALGAKTGMGLQMGTAHTPSVGAREEGLASEIFRSCSFFWLYGPLQVVSPL